MKYIYLPLFIVISGLSCDVFTNEQDLACGKVLTVAEQMPQLLGGLAALQRTVRYPEEARKNGIEGRVIVQFIVNEEGNVVCPNVIRGIGGGCDEAAIEAVLDAKFEQGLQNGHPVRILYSLPIVFRLGE